eukprot:1176686-Prorocentrum_minimum.AAC.1
MAKEPATISAQMSRFCSALASRVPSTVPVITSSEIANPCRQTTNHTRQVNPRQAERRQHANQAGMHPFCSQTIGNYRALLGPSSYDSLGSVRLTFVWRV